MVSPLRRTVSPKTWSQIKFFHSCYFVRYCFTTTRKVSNTMHNTFGNHNVFLLDCYLSLISHLLVKAPYSEFLHLSSSLLLHQHQEWGFVLGRYFRHTLWMNECLLMLSANSLCQFGPWFVLSCSSFCAGRNYRERLPLKKGPSVHEQAIKRSKRDLASNLSVPTEGKVP